MVKASRAKLLFATVNSRERGPWAFQANTKGE